MYLADLNKTAGKKTDRKKSKIYINADSIQILEKVQKESTSNDSGFQEDIPGIKGAKNGKYFEERAERRGKIFRLSATKSVGMAWTGKPKKWVFLDPSSLKLKPPPSRKSSNT